MRKFDDCDTIYVWMCVVRVSRVRARHKQHPSTKRGQTLYLFKAGAVGVFPVMLCVWLSHPAPGERRWFGSSMA